MKARLKRKIGAVAGEMGRGQHYGGNTADQSIQNQPAGDAQYEVLIEEFAHGHSSTQKTISNQQTHAFGSVRRPLAGAEFDQRRCLRSVGTLSPEATARCQKHGYGGE